MKKFSLYSLAVFIPIIIGFSLLPIFTTHLTPEDFGIRGIVLLAIILFNLASDLGTNWVLRSKFYTFSDRQTLSAYISTLLLISAALKLFLSICIFLFKDYIFPLLFPAWTSYYSKLLNFQTIIFFLSFTDNIITSTLVLEKRASAYATLAISQYLIGSLVSLLLLLYFKAGLISLFVGDLIGGIFSTAFATFLLRKYLSIKFSKIAILDIIKIGLPAVPKNLFGKLQLNINKYILSIYMAPSELGLFQKSTFVNSGFTNIQRSVGNTISPNNLKKITNKQLDLDTGKKILMLIYFLAISYVFSILFLTDILKLIGVHKDFWICGKYASFYSISVLFSSFSIIFVNNILISGKTYLFTIRSIIAGVFNIVFTVLLVKQFGITGLIISSIISSLVSLGLEIYFSESLLKYKSKISYGTFITIIILSTFIQYWQYNFEIRSGWLKSAIFIFFAITLLCIDSFFLKAMEWKVLINKLSSILKFSKNHASRN